jgi:CheY-like chemotaxis protein
MSDKEEKLVFVIDDTRVYNSFIKSYLKTLGNYRVEAFEDPDKAMNQLQSQNPFFIILDHNLVTNSRVDGLHYLEQIRKMKLDTPVFFITGESGQELEMKALKAGATKMIVKTPDLPRNLSQAITSLTTPKEKIDLRDILRNLFKGRSDK